jgi:DNA-binding helix-hairpin-helix protein with protein kinase domain
MYRARAILSDGRALEFDVVDDPPSGGMKKTFFTPDRQLVVQFYHDQEAARDPQRRARLEAVLGRFNPTCEGPQADYWRRLFCWPLALVIQPGLGLVAPTYPASYFFADGPFRGKEKEGRWFTSPRLRRMLPPAERGDWRGYFRVAILVARAVRRLHQAGLAHSDLSCRNVLIDPAAGAATVLDIDSLVVPQLFAPDVLGTPGYIAPEVLGSLHLPLADPGRKTPSARTDQHALAVLIYEYLLHRHPLRGPKIHSPDSAEEDERLAMGARALFVEHPSDRSNRPDDLGVDYSVVGPHLRELFDRAFLRGLHAPGSRPAAIDWERALIRTWDLLHPCGNAACSHGWFVLAPAGPAACPFCGWRSPRPVPALKLRAERRAGQWSPDGLVVVHDRVSLFRWHAFAGVFPGEEADATPLAYFAHSEGRWLLVNQGLPGLTGPDGARVAPGQGLALRAGDLVRLAREPNGRLAEVQFITG